MLRNVALGKRKKIEGMDLELGRVDQELALGYITQVSGTQTELLH